MARKDNPFMAIDVLTNENLGRFPTFQAAAQATLDRPAVDIQYRPVHKRKK